MRHLQRTAAPLFSFASSADLRDMGQCVGAKVRQSAVEVGAGIRRTADANGIHHHKEGARHQQILS